MNLCQPPLRVHRPFRGKTCLPILIPAFIALAFQTHAHDALTNFVQHNVRLTLTPDHIDVTFELTFFEQWSSRERHSMDFDHNGRITRPELEQYRKRLGSNIAAQVSLRVAQKDLPLVQLYNPEVDLLGSDLPGPAHHRLRLFFFAPTPSALRANDLIDIEDRLWPDAKALFTLEADGQDGCALDTNGPSDPGFVSPSGLARQCRFRCSRMPVIQSKLQKH